MFYYIFYHFILFLTKWYSYFHCSWILTAHTHPTILLLLIVLDWIRVLLSFYFLLFLAEYRSYYPISYCYCLYIIQYPFICSFLIALKYKFTNLHGPLFFCFLSLIISPSFYFFFVLDWTHSTILLFLIVLDWMNAHPTIFLLFLTTHPTILLFLFVLDWTHPTIRLFLLFLTNHRFLNFLTFLAALVTLSFYFLLFLVKYSFHHPYICFWLIHHPFISFAFLTHPAILWFLIILDWNYQEMNK